MERLLRPQCYIGVVWSQVLIQIVHTLSGKCVFNTVSHCNYIISNWRSCQKGWLKRVDWNLLHLVQLSLDFKYLQPFSVIIDKVNRSINKQKSIKLIDVTCVMLCGLEIQILVPHSKKYINVSRWPRHWEQEKIHNNGCRRTQRETGLKGTCGSSD